MGSIKNLSLLLISFGFAHFATLVAGLQVFQQRVVVNSSELCVIPISSSLIGWEKQPGSIKEIEYSARMSNSPDLPEWLKYTYDGYSSTGYIYGVPPMRLITLNLDVIGWNRYDNYEARQLIVSLEIMRKEPMEYIVELKVDNLNIRDLCIPRRMNDLTNVLAEHLNWRQKNGNNVVPVYMASAVDIGENRVPLRPNEAEGVVVHFASDKDFSQALNKLQVEVSPLWKLRPCPRDMKRTSVERHFRRYDFLVDWCSFRLQGPTGLATGSDEQPGGISNNNQRKQSGLQTSPTSGTVAPGISADGAPVDETMDFVAGKGRYSVTPEVFYFTSEIPQRTYGYEALLATLLPGSIGGLIGIMLIALLWADREDDSIYNNDNNENTQPSYTYHQIVRQQQGPQASNPSLSRSREVGMRMPEPALLEPPPSLMGGGSSTGSMTLDRGDIMTTPLPPQYSETHPNGAPALIYAV